MHLDALYRFVDPCLYMYILMDMFFLLVRQSGGGCDEYIRIYLFRAVVDYKELEALQRKGRKGPGLGTSGVGKGESFIVIKVLDLPFFLLYLY